MSCWRRWAPSGPDQLVRCLPGLEVDTGAGIVALAGWALMLRSDALRCRCRGSAARQLVGSAGDVFDFGVSSRWGN